MVRIPRELEGSVDVGEEVILMGSGGDDRVSAEELAEHIGTINYEVVCMVGKRVPRLFMQGGKVSGSRTLGI
jgi:alanine racemase